MNIKVIDLNEKYLHGVISQSCTACSHEVKWQKSEMETCQKCGARMGEPTLRFGGLEVESRGHGRFKLRNTYQSSVVNIDRADVWDTIVFLLKHMK